MTSPGYTFANCLQMGLTLSCDTLCLQKPLAVQTHDEHKTLCVCVCVSPPQTCDHAAADVCSHFSHVLHLHKENSYSAVMSQSCRMNHLLRSVSSRRGLIETPEVGSVFRVGGSGLFAFVEQCPEQAEGTWKQLTNPALAQYLLHSSVEVILLISTHQSVVRQYASSCLIH